MQIHPSDASATRNAIAQGVGPASTSEIAKTPLATLAHASAVPPSRGPAAHFASRTSVPSDGGAELDLGETSTSGDGSAGLGVE
jgi:hypothetical protein